MSRKLLVEIGTEEMPARFVSDAVKQLADRLQAWLEVSHISFEAISQYSTPRRLTVVISDVADKQKDRVEEARGPAIKIAKDEQGNWTKAAQGFIKGQGVSTDELFIKEVKGIEYIFAKKEYKGEEVAKLLPTALVEIISAMTFPKNMRWGAQELRYIRPIRWLNTIFGDELIPIEIAGIKSSLVTRGHRFLGQDIEITAIDNYKELLKQEFVIVDQAERRELILKQIKDLESENNWVVPIDEELLDEVVNLVEYPTALYGSFKQEFLELPREVLVTTMKEHQRYFSIESKTGELLPYFVTVKNGDNRSLDVVSKGNEKVLTARLADARFFYLEDQKLKISDANSKLEHIVFQEGLGTIGDKVRRIKEIATALAEYLKVDTDTLNNINRTAEICKFDLVTNMVYEFPELQGLMGEKYAKLRGEKEIIARGVYEHYLPRFSGDELPESANSQLVSIADKIDNIIGSFSLGKIPTGSQDPLGLRRQAAGIVQILLEKQQELNLNLLFNIGLDVYERNGLLKRTREEIVNQLNEFFTLRIKNLLQEQGVRYDVIDSLLETDKSKIDLLLRKALVLNKEVEDSNFKLVVDSFTRVINISTKARIAETNPKLYKEAVETELYDQFTAIKDAITKLEDPEQILEQLKLLKEPIDAYFDKVMIMVDDVGLRQQRLGLMLLIAQTIQQYTDFNKLVFA